MYFSQEDCKQIARYLKLHSIKDSEFPLASPILDGNEFFVIVQKGQNRKMYLSTLLEMLGSTDITAIPAPIIEIDANGNLTIQALKGVIYFTLDDSIPDSEITEDSANLYPGNLIQLNDTCTVRAVAKLGTIISTVESKTYTLRSISAPTISISEEGIVTITAPRDNCKLYYTTDGSTPTKNSNEYSDDNKPELTESCVVKVLAVYNNLTSTAQQEYVKPSIPDPVITIEDDTMTITAERGTIYYTLDGTDPTEESIEFIPNSVVALEDSCTIKAIAIEGTTKSGIVTEDYVLDSIPAPIINTTFGVLTIEAPKGEIHFTTDGSIPTKDSPIYIPDAGNIMLPDFCTIKAVAIKGDIVSEVVTVEYAITSIPDPTITITAEGVLSIRASKGTIYYTTDGSTPTSSSSIFSNNVVLNTPCTVKAIAILNYEDKTVQSNVVSKNYTINLTAPTITIDDDGNVTIAHNNTLSRCVVRYTTDGTEPTEDSSQYLTTFSVNDGTTVKAKVFRDTIKSNTTSKTYTAKYYIGAGSRDYAQWDSTNWYKNTTSQTGSVSNPVTTVPTLVGIGVKCPINHTIELTVFTASGFEYVQNLTLLGSDSKFNYYRMPGAEEAGFKITNIKYN